MPPCHSRPTARRLAVLLAATALSLPVAARAQSTPGLMLGQVPSPAQWNGYFGAKADATNGTLTTPTITMLPPGASTPLNLAATLGYEPNVVAYGATLNGVKSDQAALQAAANTITTEGRALIPPGTLNPGSALALPAGSVRIWDVRAATTSGFNAFFYNFSTDIVHAQNGGEWWYQLNTPSASSNAANPLVRLDRIMTHTGGLGWPAMVIYDNVAAGANPGGQTTSFVVQSTTSQTAATSNPLVGIYQTETRNAGSTQPVYGMNISVADLNNAPEATPLIGMEADISGNGNWPHGTSPGQDQAVELDVVLGKGVSVGAAMQADYGMRVSNHQADLTLGGFYDPFWVGSTNVYEAAYSGYPRIAAGASFFDASQASYTDASGVALKMAPGTQINFNSAGTARALLYATGSTALQYQVAGTTAFSVSDAGGVTAATLTVTSLPTSCTGHPTGTLWNDASAVGVCP